MTATENEAKQVVSLLQSLQWKLVLAESCTGGAVAAAITEFPGVSEVFSGSLVTYRDETKTGWLKVSSKKLARSGAVSAKTAEAMAIGALKATPEATISGAVTGHLGPKAPSFLDGVVYFAVATRDVLIVQKLTFKKNTSKQHVSATQKSLKKLRLERRRLASLSLLFMVRSLLEASIKGDQKNGIKKRSGRFVKRTKK